MSSGYGLATFHLNHNTVLPTQNFPKNQKVGETGIHRFQSIAGDLDCQCTIQ